MPGFLPSQSTAKLPEFIASTSKTAQAVMRLDNPVVVTHIDADGITAGAIIALAIREKAGYTPQILPIRQLDAGTAKELPEGRDCIFTDLGSGQLSLVKEAKIGKSVIIDHHSPESPENPPKVIEHLNPGFFGISGTKDVSGAGLAYFVAKNMGHFKGTAPLAITGAAGDIQAQGGLKGINRLILEQGELSGEVVSEKGISFFGRETRDLVALISNATEPYIQGLSGNTESARNLLEEIKIHPQAKYNQLSHEERRKLVTALYERGIMSGLSPTQISSLLTEYYIFPNEKKETEMRDATEFSTLLNSCGRNGEAKIGFEICLGDRANAYLKAKKLLAEHRENLRNALEELAKEGSNPAGKHLRVFKSASIKPTIIGIVIGIALGSRIVERDRIFIGAALQDEKDYKISARAPGEFVMSGVDLSEAMRSAAKLAGGLGGGHPVAAGATVPRDQFSRFCEILDLEIDAQLKKGKRRT